MTKKIWAAMLVLSTLLLAAEPEYRGGPVMTGPSTNYIIWYGLHWDGPAKPIVEKFVKDFGGSPWMQTVVKYGQGDGQRPSGELLWGGSTEDLISEGSSMQWRSVERIVVRALDRGALPVDASGIYHVLTSGEVRVEDFGTGSCGRHGALVYKGQLIKYLFVGDSGNVINCQPLGFGPNGLSGADAMISVIAHEIAEVITDPCADNPTCTLAWMDRNDQENADLCMWRYGDVFWVGAWANLRIKGVNYLIQENWVLGSGCQLSAPASTDQIRLENLSRATDPTPVFVAGDHFRITVAAGPGDVEMSTFRDGRPHSAFLLGTSGQDGVVFEGTIQPGLEGKWTVRVSVGGRVLDQQFYFVVKEGCGSHRRYRDRHADPRPRRTPSALSNTATFVEKRGPMSEEQKRKVKQC